VNILEITDAISSSSHFTQTLIKQFLLRGIISRRLNQLAQILTSNAREVVYQTHHVLRKFNHMAPSCFKFSQRYNVRLVSSNKNFIHPWSS